MCPCISPSHNLYSAFEHWTMENALYVQWTHYVQSISDNQWATAPGRSLNCPRPKSNTHLFSDNGVYVALQLFLVIPVSDQWRWVLIPYSYRQAPWGILHARGWLSQYTWDEQLYMVSEAQETHSLMLKARFLHPTILVPKPGTEPQSLGLPGQHVNHSAMALIYIYIYSEYNRASIIYINCELID